MYQANVYRVMIGSPSDIKEEVQVAINVLEHWNNLHSEQNKIVLLPLHWSFSSYPSMGKHPQKSLDEQLVGKSDLLVCVFGTKLGSPTDTEISGTVEEIKEHRKAGKKVMVFFKLSSDNIASIDPLQLQKIREFRENIKNDVLWCDFSDTTDFKQKLSDKLQLFINDNWKNIDIKNHPPQLKNIEFTEVEEQILSRWAKGKDASFFTLGVLGGVRYVFGGLSYDVSSGKEEAEWEDFFERLQKVDFIGVDRYDKHGKPVYKLKKAAYDYVETLSNEKDK